MNHVTHDGDDDIRSVRSDRFSVASIRTDTRPHGQHSNQSLPIHKWNWYFTADKKSKIPEEGDLRAFFKKLDIYKEAEKISYREIFERFHLLVKGHAAEWYIQYRSKFRNWTELKSGLIEQYTTPLNKFVTTQMLSQMRQSKNESASEFIGKMIRAFDSMCEYDEYERIQVILNGLRDELRMRAMGIRWRTVTELNVFLSQLEIADELHASTAPKQPQQTRYFPRRSINAIETSVACDSDPREGQSLSLIHI